jgi:hypothetical protein
MLTVPAATPVTTPVLAFTEAVVALAVLHVPPDTVLLNVMLLPSQTTAGPLNVPAKGRGNTLTPVVTVSDPQLLM